MSNKLKINEPRINEEIDYEDYKIVRIVGDNIQTKEVSLSEARKIANDMEKDLVEINGNIKVPVLKIIDYSKYLFELKKSMKLRNKKTPQLKEIQLSSNISDNDLNTKIRKAKEFISNGHKVKLVITLKGRELLRKDESRKSFFRFILEMKDCSSIEGQIKEEDNRSIVIFKSK